MLLTRAAVSSTASPLTSSVPSPPTPFPPRSFVQPLQCYTGTPQETRMLQLCLRLLGSRLAAGSVVDELVVTEKMKKQASLQKDSRASLQLQDYLGRLKQKHVLTRRLQVLCVLANLSFSPDAATASYVTCAACVCSASHALRCTGTSPSRYPQRLPPCNPCMLLPLLLPQCRRSLLPANTKMPLRTPCLKTHFCAIACLSCTASTARCCVHHRHPRSCTPSNLAHFTNVQCRLSSLLRKLQARAKLTSRCLCPLAFAA